MSKIAWFSNISSDSISAFYLDRILPFFKSEHENVIFSNLSTEYQGVEVRNYLLFELVDFDLTFFLLEDRLDSAFCFETSVFTPGIRIFIDNVFNKLKFALNFHNSNGIVYDQLLEKEGFDSAIEIGKYHMRGWSLEPYQRLYPFYYPPVRHGINILTRSCYKEIGNSPVYYLPLPLNYDPIVFVESKQLIVSLFSNSSLFDRSNMSIEVVKELEKEGLTVNLNEYTQTQDIKFSLGVVALTLDQKSLCRAALLALEKIMPFIFLSFDTDNWGQINISPGIAEKEKLKACIRQFIIQPSLLTSFRNILKTQITLNSPNNIYKELINITESNINLIKQQVQLETKKNTLERTKLISERLGDLSNDFALQFNSRFNFNV